MYYMIIKNIIIILVCPNNEYLNKYICEVI